MAPFLPRGNSACVPGVVVTASVDSGLVTLFPHSEADCAADQASFSGRWNPALNDFAYRRLG